MNSKEKIINSFVELVLQNKSSDITVKDICSLANISRKTFYNYFSDTHQIIEYFFIDKIEKTIADCLKYKLTTQKFLLNVYYSFAEDKDFFTIAIKETGQNSLFDIMVERTASIFNELLKDYIADKIRLDYLSFKFATEQTMLIKKWLCDGMQQSPEFLLDICLTSYREFEIYHESIMKKKHLQ
ncbi:MAG: TetR/AcrR family transcriptional regulator [Clostridia bacterium]|nr:TetR/AcrR family transcriptional regulator [Clostridia bacterium]